METSVIWDIMERYSSDVTIAPMHDDLDRIAFIGDWNNIPSYVERYIENHFEYSLIGYYDEYTTCSDCGNMIKTSPSYYGWLPGYWVGDGFIQCSTCAADDNYDGYVEELVNNPDKANTLMSHDDLTRHGFEPYECDYETGFHPGQTDDPHKVFDELKDSFDVLFSIQSTGQFDCHWCAYVRQQ